MDPRPHALLAHDPRSTPPGQLRDLVDLLAASGFVVTVATGFRHAREMLSADRPDLLMTDVRLGAHNGLHLALIAIQRNPGCSTVVMAEMDDRALRSEAERLGATFIVKPFTPAQIRDIVRRVTRSAPEAGSTRKA